MTTSSRTEARQSLVSFLAAVPAALLTVWATFGLANFVVWTWRALPLAGSRQTPASCAPPLTRVCGVLPGP